MTPSTNFKEHKILWETNIGSHVWSMNRHDSDIDIFTAYIAPSKDILCGKNKGSRSYNYHTIKSNTETEDHVSHEIGKVIDQIIKGNINFLVGCLSPLVIYQYKGYLESLRSLIHDWGLTKSCIPSIRGLAISNYKKYIIGSDTAREYDITKKCNTINRTLLFGINLLSYKTIAFEPLYDQTPTDVRAMLERFDIIAKSSGLPEKTNTEPFYDWLYNLRITELNNTL